MKKYLGLTLLFIAAAVGSVQAVSVTGGGSSGGSSSGGSGDAVKANDETITGSWTFSGATKHDGGITTSSGVIINDGARTQALKVYRADGGSDQLKVVLAHEASADGAEIEYGALGSTLAAIGYTENGTDQLYIKTAFVRRFVVTNAGLIGLNTETPSAMVHFSSPAGSGGVGSIAFVRISSGPTNLFEIFGTSINMSAVPVTAGSMTVSGLNIVGTGAAYIGGDGEVQIDGNGDNTKDVSITNSSMTFASGFSLSLRDQDAFLTPTYASGTFVTYIASHTMGISSSTLGQYQFKHAISSQANFCVYPWVPPADLDLTAPVILSSFGITLGGTDTGSHIYHVSVATNQAGSNVSETKFSGAGAWRSSTTVLIAGDAAGAAGDLETSTGAITLGGWTTTLIPGQLHYIIVSRDGDHGSDGSSVDSYSNFFVISYRRRFYQ